MSSDPVDANQSDLTDNFIVSAKYQIGQVVKHRLLAFRGIIFDVDPEFANTEEWYASIPEHIRPRRDQPFYHLFAQNDDHEYVAYVSEQNLMPDTSGAVLRHPQIAEYFDLIEPENLDSFDRPADQRQYRLKSKLAN